MKPELIDYHPYHHPYLTPANCNCSNCAALVIYECNYNNKNRNYPKHLFLSRTILNKLWGTSPKLFTNIWQINMSAMWCGNILIICGRLSNSTINRGLSFEKWRNKREVGNLAEAMYPYWFLGHLNDFWKPLKCFHVMLRNLRRVFS